MIRNSIAALVSALALALTSPTEAAEREVWQLPVAGRGETAEPAKQPRNVAGAEVAGRPILRLTDISEPSLEIFPADPALANGTAVIICPGGGYRILAYDLEGTEIAEWLQGIGVTALVLKYRVPKAEDEQPGERPLEDLQQAIRMVRSRATELNIDPAKVGVLGFSAGGHLAVLSGTPRDETGDDSDESAQLRPNFIIPIYPAYLADPESKRPQLDPSLHFDALTPPTFTVVTHDDADRGIGAALLLIELKKHEVPAELHVFVRGGHGYGLRPSEHAVSQWPTLCEQWLDAMGFLTKAAP